MKLVFSRKGFDSGSGGAASPIMPDGSLCSLPIPMDNESCTYAEIRFGDGDLGTVVHSLTKGRYGSGDTAHMDPDLQADSLPRDTGWRPMFGHSRAARAHAINKGVDIGDVFLFFGWFRQVVRTDQGYAYRRDAPDLHVIFGWLQIDKVLHPRDAMCVLPEWARKHPHANSPSIERPNNTLYVSTPRLQIPGMSRVLPGAGAFSHIHRKLILTADGKKRRVWRLPACFHPDDGPGMSYHDRKDRWTRDGDSVLLESACRGQEFVVDCDGHPDIVSWLCEVLECA